MRSNILLFHHLRRYWIIALCALACVLLLFLYREKTKDDFPQIVFEQLRKIRKEKREELLQHFEGIQKKARAIKTDQVMLRHFRHFHQGMGNRQKEYELDKHYVENYGSFYDILFVDSTGYVFHSIKQETDYHKNVFTSFLSETSLARKMSKERGAFFVGYEYYPPSDEPAAFFVTPLPKQTDTGGWFILQAPINRVNTILTDRENLGRTGEVYLVNEDELMLSDSRFMDDSTILKLKVDTWAVKRALQDGMGERLIKDYRGIHVFSSFERVDIFGTSWVIIAEMDEDEAITEYYRRNKVALRKEIPSFLKQQPREKHRTEVPEQPAKRVDINEFAKARPGEILFTSGVATCTAIAVLLPGKFGYLTHIPPTDDIYIADRLAHFYLGDHSTDFWGELIGRIKHFDVYPYQLKELEIILVATHEKSFERATDKMLDQGIELSRFKYLFNPQARGANVWLDMTENTLQVEWYSDRSSWVESASEVDDLATVVKKIHRFLSSRKGVFPKS